MTKAVPSRESGMIMVIKAGKSKYKIKASRYWKYYGELHDYEAAYKKISGSWPSVSY